MTHQEYSSTISSLVSNQIYLRDKVYSDTPPNNPDFVPSGEYDGDSERFRVSNHILHAVMGMADEAGEIVICLQERTIDTTNLKEEVGDYLWFLSLLLRELSLKYEEIDSEITGSRDFTPFQNAVSLSTYTSELVGMIKKALFYGKNIELESINSLLCEVKIQLIRILEASSFSLDDVIDSNLRKLKKRFGDKLEFTEDKAINRDLDAERQALEID